MELTNYTVSTIPCADGWFRPGRFNRKMAHFICRAGMVIFKLFVRLASLRAPAPAPSSKPQRILLTGLFLSDRWMFAHVRPLAMSRMCERVYVVGHRPMVPIDNVVYLPPPGWMCRTLGQAAARSIWFFWKALALRPDVVGGFHLLCNGLLALLTARLVRARSLYFCVGGWSEVLGGGAHCDNRLFGMMGDDDPVVERALLWAVRQIDLIVTMGTGARDFYRQRGVTHRIEALPGGIDPQEFPRKTPRPEYDIVGVYRLTPVKRPDVFLRAVAKLVEQRPATRAAIVGQGRLRDELVALRDELRITDRVDFVGHQDDVPGWLARAKVFLLTSDSEGVALSVMEALTAGCPVVVSNVGDLGDVVHDGVNGYLVPRGDVDSFAKRLGELLDDEAIYDKFASAARASAATFTVEATVSRWNAILGDSQGSSNRDSDKPAAAPQRPSRSSTSREAEPVSARRTPAKC